MGALNIQTEPADAERPASDLSDRFSATRRLSLSLVAPLSDADATAQSMPDASPAKWHLAHTTWFFETFVLRDHVPGYRLFDEKWPFLFNSYYEAEGPRHARPQRGLLTRPSLTEVQRFRAHVDAAMLAEMPRLAEQCGDLIELGLHHEQQHQELLLTDLKHLFSCNPLGPAAYEASGGSSASARPLVWREFSGGLVETGDDETGFAFDCERPRHKHYLEPFALASRTVTNGEWLEFMEDGGYRTAAHWLDEGWHWVKRGQVDSPLYWRRGEGGMWERFTLAGWQAVDPAAPVSHVSLFEADAYASWAGARLPTEHEWEHAASGLDPDVGNQLDDPLAVDPACVAGDATLCAMFGDVWEWTGSAYRPYPGFTTAEGAVGEYNGKFMSGQFVLKGGSCATPRGHLRASYRNFFQPDKRWQFTGLRLARSI